MSHGAPEDETRHVGDLGNILADSDGVASINITDDWISLNGINSIIGRGLVIHAGRDDMGKVSISLISSVVIIISIVFSITLR